MTNRTGVRLRKHIAALLILLGPSSAIVGVAAPAGDATASEKRPTVAGLISAAVRISPPLARLEVGLQMVPCGSVLTGEGRFRPAADLGSWARSRGYRSVSPELSSATRWPRAPPRTPRPASGPGATSGGTAPP